MKKSIALLLALIMLVNIFALFACNMQEASPSKTEDPSNSEEPSGSTELEGNQFPKAELPEWMFDINEKIKAQGAEGGRNMSAVHGGYSAEYPVGSIESIKSALAYGVDAIALYVKQTKDDVLIAIPSDSLGDFTDIAVKCKEDGLPRRWNTSAWTYEQILRLCIKNSDDSVSDYTIPTFEDVLALCAGKCFVNILNISAYEDELEETFYPLAKKYNAYSSFLLTPGASAIKKWKNTNKDDTNLESFVKLLSSTHLDGGRYVAGRAPVEHQKKDLYAMWLGAEDDENGWFIASVSGRTFIYTEKLAEYSKWISENFESSLVSEIPENEIKYSFAAESLTGRYLFVSDIHYVMAERSGQKNRVKYRGYTSDERMKELCDDIRYEYELRGLDAVFILGDLSTDDYYDGIENKKGTGYTKNACKEVYEKFFIPLSEELGIPVYITGGNHDSHSNEVWKEFSGMDRQFAVEDGENVFLICDTYDPSDGNDAMKDGNYANGNDWTDVDAEWLEEQLQKYKDKENIFIASHYFNFSPTLAEIIKKYDNVVCMFDSHTHHQKATYLSGSGNKLIINTGTYSYGDFNGDFGAECSACKNKGCFWGFQILETTEKNVISYRIDTERKYTYSSGKTERSEYTKYPEMYLK